MKGCALCNGTPFTVENISPRKCKRSMVKSQFFLLIFNKENRFSDFLLFFWKTNPFKNKVFFYKYTIFVCFEG